MIRINISIICFLLNFGLFAQQLTDEQIKELTKKPENLKAEIVTKDNKQFIHLTWGDKPHEDIPELEYLIYATAFSEVLAQQASIDIRKNSYYHPAPSMFGKNYKFQVQATYEKKYSDVWSPKSDTIAVYVPSRKLPRLYNLNGSRENNTITLSWKYSDKIDDLAGFRLYNDGQMIISEEEIPATSRSYTIELKIPGKYKFQMQAISKYGVKTDLSQSRTYTMSEE